jgi:diguanylate cyclase (GGDEF)-like protein
LIINEPDHLERLELLSILADKKLKELKETVDLYKSGNQAAALEIVLSNQGKLLMDEIRDMIHDMKSTKEQQLVVIRQASKFAVQLATYISTFAHILLILIVVVIVITIARASNSFINERKTANEKLSYQASHDPLTGLLNRREFAHNANKLLSTVTMGQTEHALCYMDLDQFKVVNDTCGHAAGDEMLRQLSQVLTDTLRYNDTLARLGGDEFGVLIENCSLDDAYQISKKLLEVIQDYQFFWEGHSFRVSVSIGLVTISEVTLNLTEVLKNADAACYIAKDGGRNRIHVYHPEDSEIAQRHGEMQWVPRINQALEENCFCLYAQDIVPLDGRDDKHYEVLLRMIDDKGHVIPPGAFLPAAERYNLISAIDRWVIENTFRLLTANPIFLKKTCFVSINLSGHSITDDAFLNFIITQLHECGIDANKICFEITETAAISNLNTAATFISTLKNLGCQFALDDFGSGLSSFAYLKYLKVDYLKIDGMFVKDIIDDPIDHAMVKSINQIGQVMGMQTIAEFVENDEIKAMLKEIGVNYAQGYGIGKPQPFDKLFD